MSSRLPAALEVSALIRQVSAAGGFATVIARGEPDSGAILVVTLTHGAAPRVYERMPHADGGRVWTLAKQDDSTKPRDLPDYLLRRQAQDAELWIIELDIPHAERFIGLTAPDN